PAGPPGFNLLVPEPADMPDNLNFGPGRQTPPAVAADAAAVPDDAEVIGVYAGGHARAYLVAALSGGPTRHVVNDLLGEQPVSVTHCERTGCSRAFTGGRAGTPLELDVAGWLHKGLALRVKDKDYAQATGECLSPGGGDPLPYRAYPFLRTTWKAWRQ